MNGTLALDGTFGYTPVDPETYPADGRENVTNDTPKNGFLGSLMTGMEVLDSFRTYTMYRPPLVGSVYVPLKEWNWFWEGKAAVAQPGVWIVSDTDQGWSFVDDFPPHPIWTTNNDLGDITPSIF